jgi:formyltetrahydrofolate deformylase
MPDANCILLISFPDRPGLIAAVAGFLVDREANIVHADQHVDRQENLFLQRIELTSPLSPGPGHTTRRMLGG